jgi:acetyl-CoA carboxylase carboxyl transferase subunit beta
MPGARERIALVADDGRLEPWDEDVVSDDPLHFSDVRPYAERLAEARERTGLGEAVLTGLVHVRGRPLVVIAGEFGFLGGSVGVATGERVARALERAVEQRLPVLALPASGGTRMQEGALALMQMAKLAAAVRRLRDAGLPYIACLMHPTTGGVLASWGSLAHVTWAEPNALLGFGGPRVIEMLTGAPLEPDVQRAGNLLVHGLLDDVVAPDELRERVARVLAVTCDGPRGAGARAEPPPRSRRGDAWASVRHARTPARPSAAHLLDAWATDVTPLRGERAGGGDDPSCLAALARVRGIPAVAIAQPRNPATHGAARMGPAGYRKALRAIATAGELRLPVLTIVDTPGAQMSRAAEEGGLSFAIANCLSALLATPVPTLAVLAGEGGSGGALALLAADRVICAEHASLEAIAPEGASAILYRSTGHAAELAASQGGASWDLERFGIVDVVVPEHPSADREPAEFAERLGAVVEAELRALTEVEPAARLETRRRRYRQQP